MSDLECRGRSPWDARAGSAHLAENAGDFAQRQPLRTRLPRHHGLGLLIGLRGLPVAAPGAQRIEPDNPLLWIELGRVRLAENNAPQADAMGRKALALGVGDPAAQAAAWHLIADSLKARGRNGEAAEAEQKAQGVAARQG